MEDPIQFSLWCSVLPGHINDAFTCIINSRQFLRPLEVRVLINRSLRTNCLILIKESLTWREAKGFRDSPPDWVKEVEIFQDDWTPDEQGKQYCEIHRYYYGGCSGCHVCTGFYVDHESQP